jgi:hypothetical protein
MTPTEYRAIIAHLGLTQVAAGEFLIGNPRTSRRWASGESAVPQPVALLLRLMVKRGVAPAYVSALPSYRPDDH